MKRCAYTLKQKNMFADIFGMNLQDYWSGLTGFDLMAFDAEFDVGEDESLSDLILREHGPEAVKLIEVLIGIDGQRGGKNPPREREWVAQHPKTGLWYGIDPVLLIPRTRGFKNREDAKKAWREVMDVDARAGAAARKELLADELGPEQQLG